MRISLFITILILSITSLIYAQDTISSTIVTSNHCEKDSLEIHEFPDSLAKFPGGEDALLNYLQSNMVFPDILCSVQGSIYIRFIVEIDGSINSIEVLKGIHPEMDKKAIVIIENMPKWKPAVHDNKAVRSMFTLPIKIRSY